MSAKRTYSSVSPSEIVTSPAFKWSILAAILLLGVAGVYAGRGLHADGSWFLLNVLLTGHFHEVNKSRMFVEWVSQMPVILALKLGVSDLNVLIRVHSFGLIFTTIGLWVGALLISFRSRLFWALLLAFSLTYLTSGFFAVGEYNLAYAAVAFVTALLFKEEFKLPEIIALLLGSLFLISAYEAMVFLGPMLVALAGYRFKNTHPERRCTRYLMAVCVVLFLLAAVISLWFILDPRDPVQRVHATVGLQQYSRTYFKLMTLGALAWALLLLFPHNRATKILKFACFGLAAYYLTSPDSWITPAASYILRAVSGFWLFFVLSISVFNWGAGHRVRENSTGVPHEIALLVTVVFLVFYVPFVYKTFGFADWLNRYEVAAKARTAWVPVEQVPASENIHPSEYGWRWSHPAMSVILRGDVSAGIDNPRDLDTWEPELLRFWIENPPSSNPLGRFSKESSIF